ncbi:hypothetical protein F4678DRAFT_246199 [Xylaria arbuscula]|nr:hypothetical protein F4678DRAFT_246199 [Xylaria arbuscula]
MILQTTMLAVQLKQLSKESNKRDISNDSNENGNSWNDTVAARQQAENMVQVSYHSLLELESERMNPPPQPRSDLEDDDIVFPESSKSKQAEVQESFDNATWLCNLIFSAVIQATVESSNTNSEQNSSADKICTHESQELHLQESR